MLSRLLISLFFISSVLAVDDRIQKNSLLHYSHNLYSQRGEDGIAQEILRRLNITKGFFVEFGAADGKIFSNTRKLVEEGWAGVFIESDPKDFVELLKTYQGMSDILCLNEYVTFRQDDPKGRTIDAIADAYFPKQEIDYMSIDVDGADYLILESLKRKPKILCVEGGFSWNPCFTKRVPDAVALKNLQQPLAVLFDIARKQGYEPVCFTQNTLFIRNDWYDSFKDIENDAVSLWRDAWYFNPEMQSWIHHVRTFDPAILNTEGPEFQTLGFN